MPHGEVELEWSKEKAARNLKKHGVSFEEAVTVFDDSHAYTQIDEPHADDEPREVIIGYSRHNRLLIVAFIERAPDRLRVISARPVTRKERHLYEQIATT